MQRIRLRRVGRKNEAHFQVVVAPHTNPVKGSFIAKLGWYNPKTKELKVDKEAVLEWIGKGAKPSNTMAKLLIAQGIKHKNIVYIPDAPGKPKAKEGDDKKKAPDVKETAPEVTDEKVTPTAQPDTFEKENADKSPKNDETPKKDEIKNHKKDNNQEEAK